VKPEQREEANQYPVIARDLIERFWVVERPVPSVKEFRRLGKLHRLKVERGEEVQTGIPADKILRPPPVVPIFRERGKVEVAEVSSEGVGEEEVETDQGGTLVRSLCEKLGEIGLNVRQTPEDVERAIGRLIELVRGIEEYTVLPDSEPALAGPREE
jgi:hypothetical protein